jgi:hypothetical protein
MMNPDVARRCGVLYIPVCNVRDGRAYMLAGMDGWFGQVGKDRREYVALGCAGFLGLGLGDMTWLHTCM